MKLIGIDIGGTKCAVITGDENGKIVKKTVIATGDCAGTMEKIFDAVADAGDADAVGISCGGPLDEKRGIILSPPNLPGWDNVAICDAIRQRFGVKCAIKNDADACAIAEWRYGAGKGCDNMVFLTFGTGMGAGLILNGAPYSGTHGAAGEVGHMRLAARGPVGYRKAGSFEGFCSGGGIGRAGVSEAEKLFAKGMPGPLYCREKGLIPTVSAKTVAEAAYKGDPAAIKIYEKAGRYLGYGISVIMDVLDPQMIVIGGLYPRCTDLLYPQMTETIKKEALSPESCRIVPSYFKDSVGDVAALSVAALAAQS